MHHHASSDRRGRVTHSEAGCDPGVPACRDVPPSAMALELRRLIPRLPVWASPPGMRAPGVGRIGFRGCAYLVGSIVERLLAAPPQ
jgi:hypothetical protein